MSQFRLPAFLRPCWSSCRKTRCLALLLTTLGGAPTLTVAADKEEFFERSVRPLLSENCYECHSQKSGKTKGGLALDSVEAIRQGGDTGPLVLPGQPDQSLLITAVRYADENLKMPPKNKRLQPDQVAILERWVREGAVLPASKEAKGPKPEDHWSFQPIKKPVIPRTKAKINPASPIDSFIVSRLEAKKLSLAPVADKAVLLRRIYYDLIGLPPTPEDLQAFLQDKSSQAANKVIERLLASPRYGERWGRHWLDLARFADTKDGVLMYGHDRIRPYAYTYRDYVIRAFNEDLPYDQFIKEQLAADQIEPKVEPWRLAAMGFLTLGRMFDNNIHDIIDDRIDTVTRGLLGLTVSCARCHNHKYDPIPQADYYSMYGVFASSEQPIELPLIEKMDLTTAPEVEKNLAAKRAEIEKTLNDQYALLAEDARARVADYLVHVATTQPDPLESAIYFLSLAPTDLRPPLVAKWRRYLEKRSKPEDPVFGIWGEVMKLPEANFAAEAARVVEKWKTKPPGTAPGTVNPILLSVFSNTVPTNRAMFAKLMGESLKAVYDEAKKSAPPGTASGFAALSPEKEQLLHIVTSTESPAYFPKTQTRFYMSRGDKDAFGGKIVELDRMAAVATNAAPRAMVLNDTEELYKPYIFVRGNPVVQGEPVPRQFLKVLSPPQRQPFTKGSGRLELAEAITHPKNPLTARVIVNRVWMHHFGEPLVSSPSDFGMRSTPPTHPELLDYLAHWFIENGWSLKKLHQLIMSSAVYQQSSQDRTDCRKVDPENKLLWRMNRQRLDMEAMRDGWLQIAGRIDLTMYGRPAEVAADPLCRRRTLYGMVDRQSLPAMFRAFDFAVPDQSVERRPHTTVPQQALYGMNSPFVLEQAKALVQRAEWKQLPDPESRVTALYERIFLREPDAAELKQSTRFIQEIESSPTPPAFSAWEQLAQALLLANESLFID